jgi:hypothetical protein
MFNLSVVLDHTPQTTGIWDRQLRALRAESAKTPDDAKRRARRAASLTRTMRWMPGLPAPYSVPVQTHGGVILNAAPGRMIENGLWVLIAEKFIRGLHYAETGHVLGKELEVLADAGGHSRIEHMNDPSFHAEFRGLPLDREVAPAPFIYGRAHFPEVSGWRFLLWRQVELFAFARPGVDPATVPADAVARSRK